MNDDKDKKISPVGEDWASYKKRIFTPEELAASQVNAAIIGELIEARKNKGVTQKKLENMSGVKQPIIAKTEIGSTNPQLKTLIKLLLPLGKTLAVVPIDK